MAETAHHQRDRALLRRSAQTNPAHGVLCQRRKRGSYHLLHLPEIQPGMEIPHPQPIYTSSVPAPNARTRPMVCFVNVESVDRIIYSIFQRFNLEWKSRTLNLFTQAA